MNLPTFLVLAVAASVAWLAPGRDALATGDRGGERGARLAAACASCHRPDGADTTIPKLAGMDEAGIARAMAAYRSGERPSQIMRVIAGFLGPDDTATVARYLATQRLAAKP